MFKTRVLDRLFIPLWFACLTLLVPSPSYSAGFGVFTQGASALGQSNAVVSHHDRPSAIFFNPALISAIPGTQVEWGSTGVLARREFTSDATGAREKSDDSLELPSHLYLTHGKDNGVSVGLGIFFPFGLTTHWPDDWEGRYLATESQVITANINPVISYPLSHRLTIAGGLSYLYLDATLKNNVNLTGLTGGAFGLLPDGKQELDGDGDGWGYNLGLLAKLTETLSLGVAYRSEIDVDIEGDVDFRLPNLSGGAAAVLAPLFRKSSAKTDLTLPQQLVAGLSYRGIENLVVEIGSRWEDWRSYDELVIQLEDGTTNRRKTDWHETWTFNLGGKYKVSDRYTLLLGYMYGQDAVPSATFEPSVPDADFQLFTIGSEVSLSENLRIDLSYGYQHHERRDKNNLTGETLGGSARGSYETDLHLVGVSLNYVFR